MLHWEKIMNDDILTVAGSYKDLVGKGQMKFGIAKKEAQQQVDELKKIVEQLKKSNNSVMGFQKSLSKISRSQTHVR
jgi:thymidylate synthase